MGVPLVACDRSIVDLGDINDGRGGSSVILELFIILSGDSSCRLQPWHIAHLLYLAPDLTQ